VAFTEDLGQFISNKDFGEAFLWSGKTIYGIFDSATYVADDRGGVPIQVRNPMALFRDVDITSMAEGDTVKRVATGTVYYVNMFAPEGTGMTLIGFNE
jgi:hypothetical protein